MDRRNLSQAELSRLINRSESAVSLYLSGDRLPPHDQLLDIIRLVHPEEVDQRIALLYCYFGGWYGQQMETGHKSRWAAAAGQRYQVRKEAEKRAWSAYAVPAGYTTGS